MRKKRHPLIRISEPANIRADELVKAFRAQGIDDISKAKFVSELILVTPFPVPQPQPVEKKRRARKESSISTAAAL